MRIKFICLALLFSAVSHAASLSTELGEALKTFRSDGPKGWAFTQTTEAGGESQVERFDPTQPEHKRWTLVQKNRRAPTPDEVKTYNEMKIRRSSGSNAPRLQDQLDLASAELLGRTDGRSRWRFRLTPGGEDDRAAAHMNVVVTFHEPSRTIEQVEIASTGPFSPVLAVNIAETKTVMTYSLPTADRPSLPQHVTLRVRGRAFWFKSLDQAMTIAFSNHEFAGKK